MRRWLADRLMPWAAANATVWPSTHAVHGELVKSHAEDLAGVEELLDALRAFWMYVEARHHASPGLLHPDYMRLAAAVEDAAEPLGGITRFPRS